MFKPLAVYIGMRYTRAKRRNHFISFISFSSIFGLAIGVAVLITVLSVWNGFEQALRERILGMTAHASVFARGKLIDDWRAVAAAVQEHPGVSGTAPFIRIEAMLTHSGKVQGALVQGILPDEEPKVSILGERMQAGRLADLTSGGGGIVLGSGLAKVLDVTLGDHVNVVVPQPGGNTGEGILPLFKQFTVVGLFAVDMHEYDTRMAFVHLDDASRLHGRGAGVTGLRLQTQQVMDAPRIGRELMNELPRDLVVYNWTQYHVNLFKALASQKTMMFIVLVLIVAVAAFNIVSTLVMVVADKEADIAILRTLGLSPGGVMGVFIVQGTLIGVAGTLLGALAGTWLSNNVTDIIPKVEKLLHTKFFPPDVYHLSEVPSRLHWPDVTQVSLLAFALCVLATLYPAWRAARTPPADALRYE